MRDDVTVGRGQIQRDQRSLIAAVAASPPQPDPVRRDIAASQQGRRCAETTAVSNPVLIALLRSERGALPPPSCKFAHRRYWGVLSMLNAFAGCDAQT